MIIIKTTSNSEKSLKKIANGLLEKNLIACVNILDGIKSIYKWENKVIEDSEYIMFIKTLKTKEKEVYDFIKKEHNYEVPEVATLNLSKIDNRFLSWLKEVIKDA